MDDTSHRPEIVYVPRHPGPLITVATGAAQRNDDIDDALDDIFGEEDQQGASVTDAVLIAAGVGAVAVGQVAGLADAVTIVGIGLIGLGAILPIRAGRRRMQARRLRSRSAGVVGDGRPLRQDHQTLAEIADLHRRIDRRSKQLVPDVQSRVAAVAHSLIEEVATLLDGALPVGSAETEYVTARAAALADLAATLDDPRVGDGDAVHRRLLTEARIEVELVAGTSALTDSAELRNDLLSGPDA